MKLKNKVAIITGAGRGLGRASAIALAEEGASTVILSRTPSELADAASAIESKDGKVLMMRADVSDLDDVNEVVDETVSVFGRIDILMNNASILGPTKPVADVADEDWTETMDINVKGPYQFSRAVIPHMSRQGGGKIINVTSGLAEVVMPPFGAYSISKAALNHMTRIMAEELQSHGISVNGLDPGIMDTDMQRTIRALGPEVLGDALHRQFVSFKEEGHLKSPDEIARLAVFLASEESDSITGEIGSELDYGGYGYGMEG
ncbi:MAG: SDR family oxidoreductase [bacterium]|nr:MAG: SDR family oxidoreductase [bacterium]